MANKKITALALLAAASITATDLLVMVDDIGGTPTTYKATAAGVRSGLLKGVGAGWDTTDYLALGAAPPASGRVRVGQGALTADEPFIHSTATWNAGGVAFRHVLINLTDTVSAAGSLFADLQIAGISKWKVDKAGNVTQAGALTVASGITATIATITGQVITPDVASNSNGIPLTLHNGATLVGTFSTTAATLPFALTVAGTITAGPMTLDAPAHAAGLTLKNAGARFGLLADGAQALGDGTTNLVLYADTGNAIVFVPNATSSAKMVLSTGGALTIAGGLTVSAGGLTVTGGIAGTLSTAAQPNITSVGTLTSLTVGTGGAAITKILSATVTWDIPNTASGGFQSTTVAVPGAVVGDVCLVEQSQQPFTSYGHVMKATVTTPGVVDVVWHNFSGSTYDPASQTIRVIVIHI